MTNKLVLAKAGYTLRVSSYENDGDSSKTVDYTVSTKEAVKFLTELAAITYGEFGNLWEPSETEIEELGVELIRLYDKWGGFPEGIPIKTVKHLADNEVKIDIMLDLLYRMGLSGGEYYTRVMEDLVVFYLPDDIEVNLTEL